MDASPQRHAAAKPSEKQCFTIRNDASSCRFYPNTGLRSSLVFNDLVALSENLTKRPLLRNFLHPLNCEEPKLVTAIRLAMDERHRSGWFERDAEGAGVRLNWAGDGERLDEGVRIPGLSGLSAGDRRRAPAAQVVDQAQAGESQHDQCGLRKTGAQDARGV